MDGCTTSRVITSFLVLIAVITLSMFAPSAADARLKQSADGASFYSLSMPFIENSGQLADGSIKFYAPTFDGAVTVAADGSIAYLVHRGNSIREHLVGAISSPRGDIISPAAINSFSSFDSVSWKSNLAAYDTISLGEVYRGVELKLKAHGRRVEKLFHIHPAGKPEIIRMKVSGAKGLRVAPDGGLEILGGKESVRFTRPVAYQMVDGIKKNVQVAYAVRGHSYSFEVGEYDRSRELVIDPVFTAAFIGGSGDDTIRSIAVGGDGSVYVAGTTRSADVAVANGNYRGGLDAFVAKLDPTLRTLVAFTYVGGAGDEEITAMTVNAAGKVVVTGYTRSADFPVTTGAFDTKYNGGTDAFVATFDASLERLEAATLYGGGAEDKATALVIDPAGTVYIAGTTRSTKLPTMARAYETRHAGGIDSFVAAFDASLKNLSAATYLGGAQDDVTTALALAPDGTLYVAGSTESADFPVTVSGYAKDKKGGTDSFIVRVDAKLKELVAGTFLGGSGNEETTALAVDGGGMVYVAGSSWSKDFPSALGELPLETSGGSDAFVAKLSASLDALSSSALFGGAADDAAVALALHSDGTVYSIGRTRSSDFPVTSGAYGPTLKGDSDLFVARFDGILQNILAATFIGGSAGEESHAMVVDSQGMVCLAGTTTSPDFAETPDAIGRTDAFVVRMEGSLAALPESSASPGTQDSATPESAESVPAATPENPTDQAAGSTNTQELPTKQQVTKIKPVTGPSSTDNTSGIAGPGWLDGSAPRISPAQAKAYYDTKQTKSQGKTGAAGDVVFMAMSATDQSPELTELARALRNDPKLIYDYVHNYIDYVPYFGSLKGATLTYLDGSGNDFDQASLMIALLQASGYTAQYQFGTMTIPGDKLANWLGVDKSRVAIDGVLSSGGIPVSTIGTDGTATFNRVWVKATINGADYLFDPAFKTYEYKSKIDLGAAMAYSQSEFLAAGGGTVGADYIQNVNEANIRSKLATYAKNLVNTIRSQYPNHDVKEIISGRSIVQSTLAEYPTTLPFSSSLSESWADIPASYVTKLRIQHPGIDHTFNVPDLSGKRLTLTYAGSDYHPELRLDGALIASGTATTYGNSNDCVVTIDHPYAAKDGEYADQEVPYKPFSGATYAIVYNFGGVSDLLQQKRQRQLDSYKAQGLADTTESVLGETLNIMGTTWLKEVAMMNRVLSSLAETVPILHHNVGFMCQESGYYIDVKAGFGSFISKHKTDSSTKHPDEVAHFKAFSLIGSALEHGILEQLMGSDKPGVSTMKLFQLANAGGRKLYRVKTIEELQSKFDGYFGLKNPATVATYNSFVSSHPCLGLPLITNAPSNAQIIFDPPLTTGSPILQNYLDSDHCQLIDEINKGNTLVLPDNGQLTLNKWKGKGYLALKFSTTSSGTTSMAMGMIIGGGYYGGYGSLLGKMFDPLPTYNPYIYTAPSPTYSSKISYDTFVNVNTASTALTTRCQAAPAATITTQASITTSASCSDPVDMASGAYYYDNSDLAMGGSETLGLEFARSYDSSFSYQKRALGYGWTHNYDIYLTPTSHAEPVLGGRQPVDAASMIAASYAMLDVLKSQDTLKGWLTASLVSKWAVDQTIDNAVTVHMGKKVAEYLRLADGTFASPPGSTTQLVKNGDNTYSLQERFGTRTDFDAKNRIAKVTDVSVNPLTFTYTGDKLTTIQDAFGRTLTLGYSTDNLINLVTDTVNNRSVSYGYTNGELTSYTDPELKIWGYGYPSDKSHRMTTMNNPANPATVPTVTNVYDIFGRVQSQIMPRQTQADGSTTATLDFFFTGYSGAMKDPAGKVTTFHFDDKGRNTIEQDPLGNRTVKAYDGQNHVVLATDPRMNQTSYQYNGQQNLAKTIKALGKLNYETIFQYDPQMRLSDVIDPLTHTTHFEYDAKHRLTLTRDNEGNTTQSTYNGPKGLKDTATDGRLTQTVFTYDSYGNPQTSKTAAHPAITYGYDPVGRMTSLTDQVNSQTTFEYDKRGLLKKIIDPSRTYYTLFDYYDDGRLWKKTDRNNNTITYTYTPGRKLETVTYPNGATVSFKYDKADDLREMRDQLGTTSYTYDAAGRLATQTDPHGFTVGYTYDAAGNLSELTYPGGKKVIYTYDELNRLKTVKIDWLSSKPVATYTWKDKEIDLLDNLVTFNGITTSYSYDTAHRLKGITIPSVASYQFTVLDGNGNRKEVTQSEPLLPTLGGGTTTYTPNTTKNRLLSAGANSFTYDNEGELKTGYGATYTFDYDHRLSGFGANSFSYDGNGNRLKAIRSGVTTRYIYDAAGNLLAEADAGNTITRYYVFGQGLLAMVTPTDQVYNYHHNAVGSTVAVTDQSQAMVNKYAYDAFGAVANQVEAIPQPFTYVGQFGVMREPNGFYYMKARYYDPNVGRFVSEDPIGFEGGDVNVSAYVQNNPINLVDPDGLMASRKNLLELNRRVQGLREGSNQMANAAKNDDYDKFEELYRQRAQTFNNSVKPQVYETGFNAPMGTTIGGSLPNGLRDAAESFVADKILDFILPKPNFGGNSMPMMRCH